MPEGTITMTGTEYDALKESFRREGKREGIQEAVLRLFEGAEAADRDRGRHETEGRLLSVLMCENTAEMFRRAAKDLMTRHNIPPREMRKAGAKL